MNQELINQLETVVAKDEIKLLEPMKKHITFRVGGPADIYIAPDISNVGKIFSICKNMNVPVTVIGNGSNLLVGDKGIRGVVLQIGPAMKQICVEKNQIYLEAGATLAAAAMQAAKGSLTGLEFAGGIPGTFGGAVVMNAGAYGGEMKDVIASVRVLDTATGEIKTLNNEELDLSYRHSVVLEKGYIVLDGILNLKPGDQETIKSTMDDLRKRRTEKQPLEFPSAGSTFKRPEGYFAGKLIMDAGLRGFCVGDAQVSEKHCGFVINRGNASAAEICELMDQVIDKVQKEFGVTLEPEVKRIGEF